MPALMRITHDRGPIGADDADASGHKVVVRRVIHDRPASASPPGRSSQVGLREVRANDRYVDTQ